MSSDHSFDIVQAYRDALALEYPPPLAAISALTEMMAFQTASTTTHLLLSLHHNSSLLLASPLATYGCQAGTRLFERWVRDAVGSAGRGTTIAEMRDDIVQEGRNFAKNGSKQCKDRIADEVQGFLKDDCNILTQGYSRVVLLTLKRAHDLNKRVNVYVSEGRPGCGGLKMHAALTELSIPCTVVLDAAVGYVMDRIDLVLVGSEAVVESGGLVAGVGTYQMALLSRALNKPFYALAESYKFLRLFPLSQADLPRLPGSSTSPLTFLLPAGAPGFSRPETPTSPRGEEEEGGALPREEVGSREKEGAAAVGLQGAMLDNNPRYDYTPREYISLVMSDVGILTPESVSSYCGVFTE